MNDQSSMFLRVSGPQACFRRPEFSRDLVSYDVLPPLTATRMVNGAWPMTGAGWRIRRITVLNPIQFGHTSISTARGERRALVLTEVDYLLEAVAELAQHEMVAMLPESAASVHLGLPDFRAEIASVSFDELPKPTSSLSGERDLGWLPERLSDGRPTYIRAMMRDGLIDLDRQDHSFCAI